MSLLPKTLLVRAFMLIVVLILLSLAASLAIVRQAEQEPRSRQLAQLVVSVVNLTRAAVLSAAPEWRGALFAELADSEGLRVQMTQRDETLEAFPRHRHELSMMAKKVRATLGDNTRFAVRRNGVEALWVSFFIGNEEFWIALPHERIDNPVSLALLIWCGPMLLLALLGAYFIARQVVYPLRKLALAAQQVGLGEIPNSLLEQGAQELISVAHAFNQMSVDLASHERERAQVLAGISHDLRTPLARVRIAAELSLDESLREGLSADVEQMDGVIRQFLDYARLDENETAVLVYLPTLVGEMVQRFSSAAQSIALELQEVPAFLVRPLLLKRTLSNLLDNAIKYGGGEITVALYKDADKVILAVMDRGPGIPSEQREIVKRPFVRLDAARSDASGSGLGLAIVERSASLHGGGFLLEERIGGGLEAKFSLPVG